VDCDAITTEIRAGKTFIVPPHPPYFPAVDGLRFVSFLLVFILHLDPKISALALPGQYGWVGVEVFFAISSFLFFTLLDREFALFGKINILKFFYRRALRIYPLMFLFATLMLVLGSGGGRAIARYIGIVTLSDNYMVAIDGFSFIIPFTGHLWTLSYEFQIYLLIPLAFLIYKALGRERFLVVVGGVWALSFAARAGFILLDAKHPLIWVTPFLRPESTLAHRDCAWRRPADSPARHCRDPIVRLVCADDTPECGDHRTMDVLHLSGVRRCLRQRGSPRA